MSFITKFNKFKKSEPKTFLQKLGYGLLFTWWYKMLLSLASVIIYAEICNIFDYDYNYYVLLCLGSPIIIYTVLGMIYAWVINPIKDIRGKL